jgi:hypothetical protein
MKAGRSLLVVGCALGLLCSLAGAQKSPEPARPKASGGKVVTQRSASAKTAVANAAAKEQQARARIAAKTRGVEKGLDSKRRVAAPVGKVASAVDAARPTDTESAPAMEPPRPTASGDMPQQYALILEGNLFRRLGWSGEPKRDPFQLVGVMVSKDARRALLSHNGSAFYVEVGAEVGEGYTVASIERGAVELQGGALGTLDLVLDRDVIGVKGARSHSSAVAKAPAARVEKKDGRWRPPKGTSGDQQWEMIMEREGVTWEDIKRNPERAGEIKESYSYIWEDGK